MHTLSVLSANLILLISIIDRVRSSFSYYFKNRSNIDYVYKTIIMDNALNTAICKCCLLANILVILFNLFSIDAYTIWCNALHIRETHQYRSASYRWPITAFNVLIEYLVNGRYRGFNYITYRNCVFVWYVTTFVTLIKPRNLSGQFRVQL